VEEAEVPVREGSAVFVDAGAEHRFTAYEHLSVLVIFERKPAENP
jgi:mannose-6-phosphate isomerase-like protein (cupin superfamily)